jgi:hypothetical protein
MGVKRWKMIGKLENYCDLEIKMKVIEQNQDRLILQSSNSFLGLLLGGIAAVIVGLFFFLIGLVIQKSNNAGIIPLGIGSAIIYCQSDK